MALRSYITLNSTGTMTVADTTPVFTVGMIQTARMEAWANSGPPTGAIPRGRGQFHPHFGNRIGGVDQFTGADAGQVPGQPGGAGRDGEIAGARQHQRAPPRHQPYRFAFRGP